MAKPTLDERYDTLVEHALTGALTPEQADELANIVTKRNLARTAPAKRAKVDKARAALEAAQAELAEAEAAEAVVTGKKARA